MLQVHLSAIGTIHCRKINLSISLQRIIVLLPMCKVRPIVLSIKLMRTVMFCIPVMTVLLQLFSLFQKRFKVASVFIVTQRKGARNLYETSVTSYIEKSMILPLIRCAPCWSDSWINYEVIHIPNIYQRSRLPDITWIDKPFALL